MDMMNGSDKTETEAAPQTDAKAQSGKIPRYRPKTKPSKRTFVPSSISFPYRDLDAGVAVALAIHGAGGFGLKTEQLAGVMGLQIGSGNFMVRAATARIFGLVKYENGKYDLTDLGFAILDRDEKRQKQARAEAFLNVPLYKRVFEEFRGKQLPPRPLGLEQAFVNYGVSPKQKDTARQIFEKSASQAGYFVNGNDRLIEPIIGGAPPPGRTPPPPEDGNGNGNEKKVHALEAADLIVGGARHPFIQGLLDTLPEPQTNWTVEGRAKWLQAAARCFDLIYKGSGEIDIAAKPAPEEEITTAPHDGGAATLWRGD